MHVFFSARLQFSQLSARQDAPWFYQLNEDPEVIRYTGDSRFASVNEAYHFLSTYDQYQRFGFGRWAVHLRENEEPLGWCGLKQREDGRVDLGYRFFRSFWGQGFATEAAVASINYGFEHLRLKRIIAEAHPYNLASIAVLKKCGMSATVKRGKELLGYEIKASSLHVIGTG